MEGGGIGEWGVWGGVEICSTATMFVLILHFPRSARSMEMTLGTWRKRWFVLKNSCLAYYMNDEDDLPRDILLFDRSFKVVRERVDSHHFEVRTTSRTLQLRANTVEECDVWCAKIMAMMRTSEFCKVRSHEERSDDVIT